MSDPILEPIDAVLVEASRGGDREAFSQLVTRYRSLVCSIAYGMTGSLCQSDEVAQETFLAAWRQLPVFELRGPESFRTYLSRIARNLSARSYRRSVDLPDPVTVDATDLASPDPSPLDRLIEREQDLLVSCALARVPHSYRVPLVMFYREQKSIEAMATELGLTETNVKTRLLRGRRILQDHLLVMIERALSKRSPLKTFTATVMAALPAIGHATPAKADVAGGLRKTAPSWPARSVAVAAAAVAVYSLGFLVVAAGPPTSRREAVSSRLEGVASSATAARHPAPGSFAAHIAPAFLSPVEPSAPGFREAAPSSDPSGDVLSFDFEDGEPFAEIQHGNIVVGPPRTGSRYALAGALWFNHMIRPKYFVVLSNYKPGLFPYSDDLVLSFDYWAAAGTAKLDLMANDSRYRENYVARLRDFVTGSWAHADIPLRDFSSKTPGVPATMEPGAFVRGLWFLAGHLGTAFYMDNVRVFHAPAIRTEVTDGIR